MWNIKARASSRDAEAVREIAWKAQSCLVAELLPNVGDGRVSGSGLSLRSDDLDSVGDTARRGCDHALKSCAQAQTTATRKQRVGWAFLPGRPASRQVPP